jgi:hypothetical protein
MKAWDAALAREFLDGWFSDETRASIRKIVSELRSRR